MSKNLNLLDSLTCKSRKLSHSIDHSKVDAGQNTPMNGPNLRWSLARKSVQIRLCDAID